jgi:hypothetical protein
MELLIYEKISNNSTNWIIVFIKSIFVPYYFGNMSKTTNKLQIIQL